MNDVDDNGIETEMTSLVLASTVVGNRKASCHDFFNTGMWKTIQNNLNPSFIASSRIRIESFRVDSKVSLVLWARIT